MEEQKTFYVNQEIINKSFFNDFIKHHIQKNILSICNKILDEYDFIECYSISFSSDKIACYNELLFLDVNLETICKDKNVLLPVYITDINTSSYYALAKCYNQNDDDNQDFDNYKTIDEILDWCPKSCRNKINNILIK